MVKWKTWKLSQLKGADDAYLHLFGTREFRAMELSHKKFLIQQPFEQEQQHDSMLGFLYDTQFLITW